MSTTAKDRLACIRKALWIFLAWSALTFIVFLAATGIHQLALNAGLSKLPAAVLSLAMVYTLLWVIVPAARKNITRALRRYQQLLAIERAQEQTLSTFLSWDTHLRASTEANHHFLEALQSKEALLEEKEARLRVQEAALVTNPLISTTIRNIAGYPSVLDDLQGSIALGSLALPEAEPEQTEPIATDSSGAVIEPRTWFTGGAPDEAHDDRL